MKYIGIFVLGIVIGCVGNSVPHNPMVRDVAAVSSAAVCSTNFCPIGTETGE